MLIRNISTISCIIIALLILVLSLIPETPKSYIEISDKVNHLIAYFLLSLSFFYAIHSKNMNKIFLSLLIISACTLYGGIIEVIQSFTGRTTELLDIVADFIGSAAGIIIAIGILFIKNKLRP